MTARDDAIRAMDEVVGWSEGSEWTFGDALDAIPASVLARLAIERGGLALVGWAPHGGLPVDGDVLFVQQSDDDLPLYYVDAEG